MSQHLYRGSDTLGQCLMESCIMFSIPQLISKNPKKNRSRALFKSEVQGFMFNSNAQPLTDLYKKIKNTRKLFPNKPLNRILNENEIELWILVSSAVDYVKSIAEGVEANKNFLGADDFLLELIKHVQRKFSKKSILKFNLERFQLIIDINNLGKDLSPGGRDTQHFQFIAQAFQYLKTGIETRNFIFNEGKLNQLSQLAIQFKQKKIEINKINYNLPNLLSEGSHNKPLFVAQLKRTLKSLREKEIGLLFEAYKSADFLRGLIIINQKGEIDKVETLKNIKENLGEGFIDGVSSDILDTFITLIPDNDKTEGFLKGLKELKKIVREGKKKSLSYDTEEGEEEKEEKEKDVIDSEEDSASYSSPGPEEENWGSDSLRGPQINELMNLYRKIQCSKQYIQNRLFFNQVSTAYKQYLDGNQSAWETLKSTISDEDSGPIEPCYDGEIDKMSDVDEEDRPFSWQALPLPNVHYSVNKADLNENGKLQSFQETLQTPGQETFFLYQQLGKGAFGTAWLAQGKDTKKWCVIKEQEVSFKNTFNNIQAEQAILKELGESSFFYQSATLNKVYFDMKLHHGICLAHNKTPLVSRKLAPDDILDYLVDYLSEAKDLLARGFVHRDYKGENQVFNPAKEKGKSAVHIIDFGIAKKINEDNKSVKLNKVAGTPRFLPPEVKSFHRHRGATYQYGEPQEVYTMGLSIAYDLALLSYWDNSVKKINEVEKNHSLPKALLEELLPILQDMTKTNPAERPKLVDVIEKLQRSQNKYLWMRSQVKNVAVVNIKDLVLSGENGNKFHPYDKVNPKILVALKDLDELIILDPNKEIENPTNINIRNVIEQIHKQTGISFKMVLGLQNAKEKGTFDIAQDHEAIIEALEKIDEGQHLNNYFYLTPKEITLPDKDARSGLPPLHVIHCNKEQKQLTKNYYAKIIEKKLENVQITSRHFEWVIKHLYQEIKHAEKRNPKGNNERLTQRVRNIKVTMKGLQEAYSENKLDYASLNSKLKELEDKMHHVNTIKYTLCQFFSKKHNTKASQLIKEMREDIRPDLLVKTLTRSTF